MLATQPADTKSCWLWSGVSVVELAFEGSTRGSLDPAGFKSMMYSSHTILVEQLSLELCPQ